MDIRKVKSQSKAEEIIRKAYAPDNAGTITHEHGCVGIWLATWTEFTYSKAIIDRGSFIVTVKYNYSNFVGNSHQ